MYAVIETGGKQYRVTEGDVIRIEKIDAREGKTIDFDKVLVIGEGKDLKIGTPYVDAAVKGKVLSHGKGEKVVIFKYKAKKDYRKKQGHRQPYTEVEITSVGGAAKKAAPAKVEAPAKKEAAKPSKSLKSMKKAELIEFAQENGIDIDVKATNAAMIETIEAALK